MAITRIGTPTKRGKRANTGAKLSIFAPTDGNPGLGDYVYIVLGVRTLNGTGNDPGHSIGIQHAGEQSWTIASVDAGAANDTKEVWVAYKPWEATDATDPQEIVSQVSEPARAATCFILRGVDSANPFYSGNSASSTASPTAHTLASVTIATVGDWYIGCLTDDLNDASIIDAADTWAGADPPDSVELAQFKQSSSGSRDGAFSAAIAVRYVEAAATGATAYTFTHASGDDYASYSFGVAAAAGQQTVDGATNAAYEFPGRGQAYDIVPTTTPAAESAAETFALVDGQLVAKLTVEPLDPSTQATTQKLLSTHPLGGYQLARMESFPTVERSIMRDGKIGGGVVPSTGNVSITNQRRTRSGAADLDSWIDLDWDQRTATLQAEFRSRDLATVLGGPITIGTLRTKSLSYGNSDDKLVLRLTDPADRLDKFVQDLQLGGTGGLDGGPEMEGHRPAVVFGKKDGVELKLLDRINNIWLVAQDAAGTAVTLRELRVGGNPIPSEDYTFTAASGPGTANTVKITTDLDDTKDVRADITGIGGTDVPTLLRYILTTEGIGPVPAANIDTASFDALRALMPGDAGWLVQDEAATKSDAERSGTTFRSLADGLTAGWCAWGFNRSGQLYVRALVNPYYDHASVDLPFAAVIEHSREEPILRHKSVVVGYRTNPKKVSQSGVATLARSTEYGNWMTLDSYRIAQTTDGIDTDGGLQPSARVRQPLMLPFYDRVDAYVVFGWLWDIYSGRAILDEVLFDHRALVVEPGDCITYTLDRHGITAKKARVLSVADGPDGVRCKLMWMAGYDAIGDSSAFVTTEESTLIGTGGG